MIEFEPSFNRNSITEPVEQEFEILYNTSRLSSTDGKMYITDNKIYFLFTNPLEKTFMKPWCIETSEISSYKKTGLAGYLITLRDGKVLRFSNVFMGLRKKLTDALDQRVK